MVSPFDWLFKHKIDDGVVIPLPHHILQGLKVRSPVGPEYDDFAVQDHVVIANFSKPAAPSEHDGFNSAPGACRSRPCRRARSHNPVAVEFELVF